MTVEDSVVGLHIVSGARMSTTTTMRSEKNGLVAAVHHRSHSSQNLPTYYRSTAGEAHQIHTDTPASTGAHGRAHGGGEQVQDGERGGRDQGQDENFFDVQFTAWDEVRGHGDDDALEDVLEKAQEYFAAVECIS